MIVAVCLILLTVLDLFIITIGGNFIGAIVDNVVDGSVIINGSSTSFTATQNFTFNIDPIAGMTANIIIWTTIAIVIGMRVFGSGLSDQSVKFATAGIIYTALWTLLSTISVAYLFSIPIFGAMIYVALTIAYVIGVMQKIIGGQDGE